MRVLRRYILNTRHLIYILIPENPAHGAPACVQGSRVFTIWSLTLLSHSLRICSSCLLRSLMCKLCTAVSYTSDRSSCVGARVLHLTWTVSKSSANGRGHLAAGGLERLNLLGFWSRLHLLGFRTWASSVRWVSAISGLSCRGGP